MLLLFVHMLFQNLLFEVRFLPFPFSWILWFRTSVFLLYLASSSVNTCIEAKFPFTVKNLLDNVSYSALCFTDSKRKMIPYFYRDFPIFLSLNNDSVKATSFNWDVVTQTQLYPQNSRGSVLCRYRRKLFDENHKSRIHKLKSASDKTAFCMYRIWFSSRSHYEAALVTFVPKCIKS